jgi:hypothetical protein
VSGLRRGIVASAALLAGPSLVAAGDVEVSATVGYAAPTYNQSLSYSLGDLSPLPGLRAVGIQPFKLDATGGAAFSAGLVWYFAGPLGVEGRFDALNVDLQTTGAVYELRTPSGATPVARLQMGGGAVQVDPLHTLSLNLRLSTSGPLRFALSGGASWLPAIKARSTQTVHLDVLRPISAGVDLATLALTAEAAPANEGGFWGANAGVTVGIGLSRHVAVVAEARAFAFRKRTLRWTAEAGDPATPFEAALLDRLSNAEPITFDPLFFDATVGLALRF